MKDVTPWAISAGDSIQVSQRIVTGADGHAMFQVSDGSTFEVYPNSTVEFRKNPGNWKDLLDLLVGRVRVHIEHLGNLPNPTKMVTPTAVISVRGTTFDVSVDDDDETTLVEVEDGIVEVQHALLPRDERENTHSWRVSKGLQERANRAEQQQGHHRQTDSAHGHGFGCHHRQAQLSRSGALLLELQ